MTTLIVQLPPRDIAVPSQEWRLPPLPFMLFDKRGRTLRAGQATLATLPRARRTVLLFAARDVLLLHAVVPPLTGPRLRQALPNVIEDQLIQDPQTCHIALDPQPLAARLKPLKAVAPIKEKGTAMPRPKAQARRVLAVIDRGWFRFVHTAFQEAGHLNLRAVPISRCLPAPSPALTLDTEAADALAEMPLEPTLASGGAGSGTSIAAVSASGAAPPVVAIIGASAPVDPDLPDGISLHPLSARVELAVAQGVGGEGLAVPADALPATLAALLPDIATGVGELYRVTELPGRDSMPRAGRDHPDAALEAQIATLPVAPRPLPFEVLARNAIECRFDLCQFEFAPQLVRLQRGVLKQARLPAMLLVATLVVAIIGVNVQWAMLAHQRDAINARFTELLLSAFPKTTVVLDAPTQMSRQLDALRTAAGQLSPRDFLALADGLSRSLGPVPLNAIATLDYQKRSLDVGFKPGTNIDADAFTQRLARNGLAATSDGSHWIIRSSP